MTRHRGQIVAAVACACVLVGAASAFGAQAPGVTFSGSAADGANVAFALSPDGTLVQSYRVAGARGATCSFTGEGDSGVWAGAPLIGGGFSYHLGSAIRLAGRLTGARTASGTFRFVRAATHARGACDTGTVRWTASIAGSARVPAAAGLGAVSTVTLRRLSATVLAGVLRSPVRACLGARALTLWLGSRRVGRGRTRADGRFTVPRPAVARRAELRASVSARTTRGESCAAGSSTFTSV